MHVMGDRIHQEIAGRKAEGVTERTVAPTARRKETGRPSALATCTLVIVSILLAGCGEKPTEHPPPPPKVTVAQPVQRVVTDYLELTGNTQAIYTVQLVARVAGYLEEVLFRDGQMVKKGEPLFLIQQNTYEDNLQQAEASILQYRAQWEYGQAQFVRYSNLLE